MNILAALANPVRLRLIDCMAGSPKNVTQLIVSCGLSQSAVSQHLAKLRRAGIVTAVRDGRHVYYTLADQHTATVSAQIQTLMRQIRS